MKTIKKTIQNLSAAIAAMAILAPANMKAEETEILPAGESRITKTGSAEPVPSGIEITGGYETFSLTRPEVANRITVSGLNLNIELINVSKSRFLAEGGLQYRFLSGAGGIDSLETIIASLKPSFKIFGIGKKLEFELYAGSSVIYNRTATDSVRLNEVVGIMYSYSTIFAAPRIKLVTGLYDRLYNELAFEAGPAFTAEVINPYVGWDIRIGYEQPFWDMKGSIALTDTGRRTKGEKTHTFGAELRWKFGGHLPYIAAKGFRHDKTSDYFKGSGWGIVAGFGL